jgi:hypothetical protein
MPERDTRGRVEVDEGGTGIEIYDGEAQVETDSGQQLRLSPNERVQVNPEGVAAPKTTLPPAPVVMDVPRPPRLSIHSVELRGDQLHLSGLTEPGAALTVNDEYVRVQQDGTFNEHVVLTPGTNALSIRATGKTGAVTQQTLPLEKR